MTNISLARLPIFSVQWEIGMAKTTNSNTAL